jgi:hypothetical protein
VPSGRRTPDAGQRGGDYSDPEKALERVAGGHQTNLNDQAVLAGWGTPRVTTNCGIPRRLETILTSGTQSRLEDEASLAVLAGWPTTTVNDSRNGRNATSGRSNPDSKHHPGTTLCDAAVLAGWPTATVLAGWPTTKQDHGIKSVRSPEGATKESERKGANDLNTAAVLAGWPTTTTRDWKDSSGMAKEATNPDGTARNRMDRIALLLAGYPTPKAQDAESAGRVNSRQVLDSLTDVSRNIGMTSSTSPAPMAKRGQLNPSLSRWLMGYPRAWCEAAIEAWHRTPTTRRKRG